MIYTITLNPAIDYYMGFNEKKINALMRSEDYELLPGGKGINSSILLKNLGINNEAIILTGAPTGQILLNILESLGIKYKNFDIKNATRINVKADVGETFELNASTENKNPNISDEIYEYLKKTLKEKDVVMIMGTTMKGLPPDIIHEISKIACKKRARIVYDIQGKEILDYLQYKPLVIKPNTYELELCFENKINSFEDIKKSALKLLQAGAQNVIVSQDKDGAYLFNKEVTIKTNPLNINLVNSSGAGDSMIAGFIQRLIENNNYEEAINFANASGAGTASVKSIADARVINSLYEKVTSQKIK